MSNSYRFMLVGILILVTLACSLVQQTVPPTETVMPPSNTPVFTETAVPSNTPVPSDTAAPTATSAPIETPAPVDAAVALQTAMVGTLYAQFGSAAHLSGFLNFYSNPVGTPVESWHDIPIMKEATTGQEFQADIYSYKAAATLKQATDFYTKAAAASNWSCFPPAAGSAGAGAQANHQSTFLCGALSIVIASFDKAPDQVLVVINKAP